MTKDEALGRLAKAIYEGYMSRCNHNGAMSAAEDEGLDREALSVLRDALAEPRPVRLGDGESGFYAAPAQTNPKVSRDIIWRMAAVITNGVMDGMDEPWVRNKLDVLVEEAGIEVET